MDSPRYLDEVVDNDEEVEMITDDDPAVENELAVGAWLWTFPQISESGIDESFFRKEWMGCNNNQLQSAILSAAAEICGKDQNMSNTPSDCWNLISQWVGCDDTSPIVVLSSLLCFVVAEDCIKRNDYIGRIMGLDPNVQRILMQVIKTCNDKTNQSMMEEATPQRQSHLHPDESYLDDLNIDEDNESLLDDDDDKENFRSPFLSMKKVVGGGTGRKMRSPLSPYRSPTPNRNLLKRAFSGSTGRKGPPDSAFSQFTPNVSARKVINLEKKAMELNEKNRDLTSELERSRQQEKEMRLQLEEMEAKNRAVTLKLESEALFRETEIREEMTQRNIKLENEVRKALSLAEEGKLAMAQLANLKDEVDVLQDSKFKLQHAEEQVRKLKLKLEQLGDVNQALKNEERAHSNAVEKCLKHENELAALIPLRRQLEEYKSRATNAEFKVADYEDELCKLRESSRDMNGLNTELRRGTLRQQAESEQLRKNMEEHPSGAQDGVSVGEGISELNPQLKEELLRLRSENTRLKHFAAKREDDSVQRLEEELDDSKRLAKRFKEQYLATKKTLETTQNQLSSSLQRETELRKNITDLKDLKHQLDETLQHERISAQNAKLDAEMTLRQTKETMNEKAKNEKNQVVEEWQSRLEKEQNDANTKYVKLEDKCKEKEELMTVKFEEERQKSMNVLEEMRQKQSSTIASLQRKHKEEIDDIQSKNQTERDQLVEHGKQLIQKNKLEAASKEQGLNECLQELTQEREEMIKKQKEYEQKVVNKIQSYRQRFKQYEARLEESAKENDELQSRNKKLERNNSSLQGENDRFRRQLGGRFGAEKGQYEELQREYNSLLEENRKLKRIAGDTTPHMSTMRNAINPSSHQYSGGTSVSASSLTQLRTEFEEKIEEINDEKRELVMKNSSLVSNERKAQKRGFELEVEVKKLQNENTSLQLQLERKLQEDMRLQSPPPGAKRMAAKLTPHSIAKKASRMWKDSKMYKRSKSSPPEVVEVGSPTSTTPVIRVQPSTIKMSLDKIKGSGDAEEFKTKLAERLVSGRSASKKITSPPITVCSPRKDGLSLMDLVATASSDSDLGIEEWEITFGEN